MDFWDALQYLGETVDKPGRAARGAAVGDWGELANLIPFSDTMGLTNPDEAVSGRNVLENYDLVGADEEGLDWGDAAGFGLEMILDPLNLIPGIGGLKAAKAGKLAEKANSLSRVQRAMGFMPEEIAAKTKMLTDGKPTKYFHGSPVAYGKPDAKYFDPDSLFSAGHYGTVDPHVAGSYADRSLEPFTTFKPKGDEAAAAADLKGIRGNAEYYPDRAPSDPIGDAQNYYLDEGLDTWDGISVPEPMYGDDGGDAGLYLDGFGYTFSPQTAKLDHDIKQSIEGFYNVSEEIPTPNTRMHYLDLRNPFHGDTGKLPLSAFPKDIQRRSVDWVDRSIHHTRRRLEEIADEDRMRAMTGQGDAARDMFGTDESASIMEARLKDLLERKEQIATDAPIDSVMLQERYSVLPQEIGKAARGLGHDGVMHQGGIRHGNTLHDVAIAFDPKDVYLPYIADAIQDVPTAMPYAAGAAVGNPLMQLLRQQYQ